MFALLTFPLIADMLKVLYIYFLIQYADYWCTSRTRLVVV